MGSAALTGFLGILAISESSTQSEQQVAGVQREQRSFEYQAELEKTKRSSERINEEYSRVQQARQADISNRERMVADAATGFSSSSISSNAIKNYDMSLLIEQDKINRININSANKMADYSSSYLKQQSTYSSALAKSTSDLGETRTLSTGLRHLSLLL